MITAPVATRRDLRPGIALAAAAISLLGYLTLFIGHLVDPGSFNNGKHASAANNAAFLAYVFGLLVALVLGSLTWLLGRRRHPAREVLPAKAAAIYGVVFLVVGIISAALGG